MTGTDSSSSAAPATPWPSLRKQAAGLLDHHQWSFSIDGQPVSVALLTGEMFPLWVLAADACWLRATGHDLPGFVAPVADEVSMVRCVLPENAPEPHPVWPWLLALQEALAVHLDAVAPMRTAGRRAAWKRLSLSAVATRGRHGNLKPLWVAHFTSLDAQLTAAQARLAPTARPGPAPGTGMGRGQAGS